VDDEEARTVEREAAKGDPEASDRVAGEWLLVLPASCMSPHVDAVQVELRGYHETGCEPGPGGAPAWGIWFRRFDDLLDVAEKAPHASSKARILHVPSGMTFGVVDASARWQGRVVSGWSPEVQRSAAVPLPARWTPGPVGQQMIQAIAIQADAAAGASDSRLAHEALRKIVSMLMAEAGMTIPPGTEVRFDHSRMEVRLSGPWVTDEGCTGLTLAPEAKSGERSWHDETRFSVGYGHLSSGGAGGAGGSGGIVGQRDRSDPFF